MSFAFPKKERKEPFDAILGGLLIYHRIHSNMYRSQNFSVKIEQRRRFRLNTANAE